MQTETNLPSNNLTTKATLRSYLNQKIGKKEQDAFASFAKKQIGRKDAVIQILEKSEDVLERIAEIFSQRSIPAGLSISSLVLQFKSWHSKDGAGIKRLGHVADSDDEQDEFEGELDAKYKTAGEGGFILADIGKALDLTPARVNQLIDALTSDKGKLATMRNILKEYSNKDSNEVSTVTFSKAVERATIKAAGLYTDLIEEARDLDPTGETVTVKNLISVLEKNKLRESMDAMDKSREEIMLETFVEYANDSDYATDDEWKDVVMEMLRDDLLESPAFATRENLNVVKSFQNLVANIVTPPAKRGRPRKNT